MTTKWGVEMFDRVEKSIDQCRKNTEEVLRQCKETQGVGGAMVACIRSTNAILDESNNILQDTGRKIDTLIEILYSWRDRALAAEARVQELKAQHRTEICEQGYDCVTLGKERSRADAAESERDMWAKMAKERADGYRKMRDRAIAAETENNRLHDSIDYARTKDAEIMRLSGKLDKAEMLLKDLLSDYSDAICSEKPLWAEWWSERIKEYFGAQEEQ